VGGETEIEEDETVVDEKRYTTVGQCKYSDLSHPHVTSAQRKWVVLPVV